MKRAIVIYDTRYGNTEKIAGTMAETMKDSGIAVDLFYLKKIKKLGAEEYDFLVLGSPTRFGTMSLAFRGFLGRLKQGEWMNKPFAAFDTELPDNIETEQGSAAEKIAAKLRDKKMTQLLPVLKAVVLGMKGPLKEGEIQRARDYARELSIRMKGEQVLEMSARSQDIGVEVGATLAATRKVIAT